MHKLGENINETTGTGAAIGIMTEIVIVDGNGKGNPLTAVFPETLIEQHQKRRELLKAENQITGPDLRHILWCVV